MDFINKNLRGILFCFALAVPATYLGKLFPVVGAPVFAILFGLAAAFWKRPAFFQPGIQFTAKKILQYSILETARIFSARHSVYCQKNTAIFHYSFRLRHEFI